MKVKIIQEVDVPISPFCRNCFRKERDMSGKPYCSLFNRVLCIKRGDYLKCRECYIALYDSIDKGDC